MKGARTRSTQRSLKIAIGLQSYLNNNEVILPNDISLQYVKSLLNMWREREEENLTQANIIIYMLSGSNCNWKFSIQDYAPWVCTQVDSLKTKTFITKTMQNSLSSWTFLWNHIHQLSNLWDGWIKRRLRHGWHCDYQAGINTWLTCSSEMVSKKVADRCLLISLANDESGDVVDVGQAVAVVDWAVVTVDYP